MSSAKPTSHADPSSAGNAPLGKLFKVLGDKYPNYKSQIDSVEGLAKQAVNGMHAAAPAMEKAAAMAQKTQAKAKQLHLEEFIPLLMGLAMCFFGGYFPMLIAVVETVRLVCWEDIKASYAILKRNYDVAAAESRKDDLVDADGNGVADVLEMERNELISRKIGILVKSVDMDEVRSAGRTLMAGLFSVIAALRVRAARSLALAGSLAKSAQESIPLERLLEENLPADQRKWSGLIAGTAFNGISLVIAFVLRSFEAYIHSSVRGASMFVKNAIRIGHEKKLLEPELTVESHKARVLIGIIAAMGLLWQVSAGGALPLMLKVLLFPLIAAEFLINGLVSLFLLKR